MSHYIPFSVVSAVVSAFVVIIAVERRNSVCVWISAEMNASDCYQRRASNVVSWPIVSWPRIAWLCLNTFYDSFFSHDTMLADDSSFLWLEKRIRLTLDSEFTHSEHSMNRIFSPRWILLTWWKLKKARAWICIFLNKMVSQSHESEQAAMGTVSLFANCYARGNTQCADLGRGVQAPIFSRKRPIYFFNAITIFQLENLEEICMLRNQNTDSSRDMLPFTPGAMVLTRPMFLPRPYIKHLQSMEDQDSNQANENAFRVPTCLDSNGNLDFPNSMWPDQSQNGQEYISRCVCIENGFKLFAKVRTTAHWRRILAGGIMQWKTDGEISTLNIGIHNNSASVCAMK